MHLLYLYLTPVGIPLALVINPSPTLSKSTTFGAFGFPGGCRAGVSPAPCPAPPLAELHGRAVLVVGPIQPFPKPLGSRRALGLPLAEHHHPCLPERPWVRARGRPLPPDVPAFLNPSPAAFPWRSGAAAAPRRVSSAASSCCRVRFIPRVCACGCPMLVVQPGRGSEIGMRRVGAACEPACLPHSFRIPGKY